MSYRSIFFKTKGISRNREHRFSKFQKSKLPSIVLTPPKTMIIEVEVPIEDVEPEKTIDP